MTRDDWARMAATDPRESRLPKWAQAELAALRRKLSESESRVRERRGDVTDTDTTASLSAGLSEEMPLPQGARVSYRIADGFGGVVRAYVHRDQWRGRRLYVQGDRTLLIEPRASNTFYVDIAE